MGAVISRHTRISTTSSNDEKPPLPYQQSQPKNASLIKSSTEEKQKLDQINKVSVAFGATIRPQLPKNRNYSVILDNSRKLNYPQMRIMVDNYPNQQSTNLKLPFTANESTPAEVPVSIVSSGKNFLFSSAPATTASGNLLNKGDIVQAIGAEDLLSSQGRIAVIKDGTTHHIPFAASKPN